MQTKPVPTVYREPKYYSELVSIETFFKNVSDFFNFYGTAAHVREIIAVCGKFANTPALRE